MCLTFSSKHMLAIGDLGPALEGEIGGGAPKQKRLPKKSLSLSNLAPAVSVLRNFRLTGSAELDSHILG